MKNIIIVCTLALITTIAVVEFSVGLFPALAGYPEALATAGAISVAAISFMLFDMIGE
nr:MAG TPA: hypothetical protein [Caudoviricetes sp.]